MTLKQVEDAIDNSNANVGGDMLTLGSQAHNVRVLGLLGGGTDPLEPARIDQADAIEAQKIDDINNVVVTTNNGIPIYVRQLVEHVVEHHRPRLGIVGRLLKEKDGHAVSIDEDDVIEGIVLMRKYEKSLRTAELVEKKLEELDHSGLLPKGVKIRVFNQRTDLVHVTTRQRPAQPRRGDGPGGGRSCSCSWAI